MCQLELHMENTESYNVDLPYFHRGKQNRTWPEDDIMVYGHLAPYSHEHTTV